MQPFISGVEFAPYHRFNWYFWKRPDPDFWSRLSVWGGYILHQVFIWGVIAWAAANPDRLKSSNKMHPINWIALSGTAFFVLLHYSQTAIFYDGLGQGLPVTTSQLSAIIVLVLVLLMESPRRGLFLGTGVSWFSSIRPIVIRYHGYYFAWSVMLTYWYYPMETSYVHIVGFLYTFFMFFQASFIFTCVHSKRIWKFILEASVLIHGVIMVLVAGQEFWTMFGFGFLFLVVVTQMHGLDLGGLTNRAIALVSLVVTLWVYSDRGWANLNEVLLIPIIDYLFVGLFGGILIISLRLMQRNKLKTQDAK